MEFLYEYGLFLAKAITFVVAVGAIIAVIAAIAIPGLLRSRMAANEANGVGALRTIYSAEIQFQVSRSKLVGNVPQYGSFTELGGVNPPLLGPILGGSANPVKAGYLFTFINGSDPDVPSFAITASAQSAQKGSRNFYTNDSGVIRWTPQANGDATSTDQPL